MKETGRAPAWRPPVIAYLAVWLFCVLWFWLGRGGGGWIMAYTILAFMVLLPLATLVTAFLLELRRDLDLWLLPAAVSYGLLYTGAICATFVLATRLGVANLAPPSPATLLVGLTLSTAGMGLGRLVRKGKLPLWAPTAGLSVLLAACYVLLKTLNGSLLRFLPVLDIPALILLLLGLWGLVHSRKWT